MMNHRAVSNTVLDINRRYGVTERDAVLGLSALNFDLSVWDIFGVLAAGGRLVLPAPCGQRDPAHWCEQMATHGVTLWNTVPALQQMWLDWSQGRSVEGVELRLVMLSGDWIPLSLPSQLAAHHPNAELHSLGGATEAAIWSISYPVTEMDAGWSSIPYGMPLANQQMYVLDGQLQPKPTWSLGDIYIGGEGLADGYWADKARTDAQFITHPVSGERLYRTGDMGRMHPQGYMVFEGRTDSQVKVRGHRIELGEISSVIETLPQVQQAVTQVLGTGNQARLASFIVPEGDNNGSLEAAGSLSPLARAAYKLSQPQLEHWGKDTIALAAADPDTLLLRVPEQACFPLTAPLTLTQLGLSLSGIQARPQPDAALPKYAYPSAGSLYPVQCYLSIGEGAVEGLAAGQYYYHPVNHTLDLCERVEGLRGIQLHLIGKLVAIKPLYGDLSDTFCALEAGYLHEVLLGALQANGLSLSKVTDGTPTLPALSDTPMHLGSYRLTETAATATRTAFLHRQSVRQFLPDSLSDGELARCLPALPAGLSLHIWHDGDEGAFGEALSSALPGTLWEEAKVVLVLCGEAHHDAGRWSQQLMQQAAHYDIGLCPAGISDTAGLSALTGTPVLHCLVGGYVTPETYERWQGERLDSRAPVTVLKEYVGQRLPDYMVPDVVCVLESLPLTANGKLDRQALTTLAEAQASENDEYVAPTSLREEALCQLFGELLGLEQVGVHDNFFRLGGSSVDAVKLQSLIRERLGQEMSLQLLFENPSVVELNAVLIDAKIHDIPTNLIPDNCRQITPSLLPLVSLSQREIDKVCDTVPGGLANISDIYPLTAMQKGLVFQHQLSAKEDPYLFELPLSFNSQASLDRFLTALNQLVARHDVLRTVFVLEDLFEQVQVVLKQNEIELKNLNSQVSLAPDLAQGPLIQLFVSDDPVDNKIRGKLICHHVIIDYVGQNILLSELLQLLRQIELPDQVIPFRDVVWLEEHTDKQRAETYFRERLGSVSHGTVPYDVVVSNVEKNQLHHESYQICQEITERIRSWCRENSVIPAAYFHTVFGLMLARLTHQHQVVFGTVLSGRGVVGSSTVDTIGPMINTLPLMLDLENVAPAQLVKNVADELGHLSDFSRFSLKDAQALSGVEKGTPLFTALFNYRQGASQTVFANAMSQHGVELLSGAQDEFNNFPITVIVDDDPDATFTLSAITHSDVPVSSVITYVKTLAEALIGNLSPHDANQSRVDNGEE
ncbi:hypothetical protein CS022_23675 [Veronia nyctiphanis]|uniref:Carrier domain-containing protein n=1 Tax=Veronia nyctiphanis TaxID=1278244 RepID=A0A4Q0YL16_9GAMM|nr:condensation domain-containing protein [Veronia nyctiphanis]RXJ69821.1 hypothetical protein CS022_23675 [Veronia nyctiphanis]